MKVESGDCRVVGLAVVTEDEFIQVGFSGFSVDHENGTISVSVLAQAINECGGASRSSNVTLALSGAMRTLICW